MEKIYLIEQIWIDPMENKVDSAVGYEAFGWVSTQKEAEERCSKGRSYTKLDCWAINKSLPEFKWRELKSLKP